MLANNRWTRGNITINSTTRKQDDDVLESRVSHGHNKKSRIGHYWLLMAAKRRLTDDWSKPELIAFLLTHTYIYLHIHA